MTPRRQDILQLLGEETCAGLRDVARRMNLSTSATKHHLSALEKAGYIRSHQVQNRLVFVPSRTAAGRWRHKYALGRDPLRRLLRAIGREPGSNQSQLARVAGMSPSGVRYHLETLIEMELVHDVAQGARKVYYLA